MTLYLKHFGLREAPFKITPTTEFFYAGGRRGEILHALQYAITSGEGIMMVSGEVGSGKTMLLRTLIEKLPDDTEIVYIPNPSLSGNEILYHICEELNLKIDATRSDTVRRLQNYLIEKHAAGHRVIAFIDEAQAMPDESLEEIRLLSNLETSRNKLLQIVLFGQPELDDKLRRQNMRQLRERITVALNLQPFSYRDVREYISTRLSAAGYNGPPLFSDDAGKLIAAISQGLSRRINVLADKSMLSAFERNGLSINYSDSKRAAKDVKFGKMRYRSENSKYFSRRLSVGIAATSCFVLFLALGLRWIDKDEPIVVADTLSVEAAEESSPLVTTAEESEEAMT
ncbi:MAG: AAA family ATPase [Candidatus Zeuxoniibacter abyssi]|nr:MAG: AAA family ATPase [Candidatus Persebacteraceae bacterium AB1(2)]